MPNINRPLVSQKQPSFKQPKDNSREVSLFHKYFDLKKLLIITVVPPAFLLMIYYFLGGLALFMFLMGMSTVLAIQLWIFHVYFNFEDEFAEKPLYITPERKQQDQQQNQQQNQQQFESSNVISSNYLGIYKENNFNNTEKIDMTRIQMFNNSDQQQQPKSSSQQLDNYQNLMNNQNDNAQISQQIYNQSNFGNQTDSQKPQSQNKSSQQSQTLDVQQNRESILNFNEESLKMYQDIQSNPLTNLSPDNFQGLSADELIKKFGSSNLTERIGERTGAQACKCRIEKDNFKLVIKAKSQKILSFLNLIENFYTQVMKNEQLNGRNFSKLGHPSIQIIGQFNELVLFKDVVFDDHQFMTIGKIQQKGQFAFCKWRLIRKVFNEMGVCHVENALFYKQGILANITALNDTVNIKVKQFQQKHLQLCEELDVSEKKLIKIRNDYAKDSKIVDECIQNYTKANQSINNYQKLLELEMRFKLSYKKMQDTASQVSDALDSLCETREKFQQQTKDMVMELWSLDRNKTEIFKSTLMSVVDTYHEFESQIQTYLDECMRQSNTNQKTLVTQINSDKASIKITKSYSGVSSSQDSQSEEEEKFFDKQRKRSIKFKKEEVQKFMEQIGIDEDPVSQKVLSRDISVGSFNRNTIGPKDMIKDFSIMSVKGDDNEEHHFQGSESDEDMQEENLKMDSIDHSNINMQKLPHEYNYSPQKNKSPKTKQSNNVIIFKDDEEDKQEFQSNMILSPPSQSSRQSTNLQDISIIETNFGQNQTKYQINLRQVNQLIQGLKDFNQYLKQMQSYIKLYYQHLNTIIENQYEDATHVTNQGQIDDFVNQQVQNLMQQTVKKVRQLKIKQEKNDIISRIWLNLINNFKSYVNQYEQLCSRLMDLQQTTEQFISQIVEKKIGITESAKNYQSSIRKHIAESKSLSQQMKQISHLQHHKRNDSITNQNQKQSTYQQYIQSYHTIKSKYLNSSAALGKLQPEQLSQEEYEKLQKMLPIKYNKLSEVHQKLNKSIKEYQQLIKNLEPIKCQIKDKIFDTKSELMSSHQERSKNSQTFFKNLIQSIEQTLFMDNENCQDEAIDLENELMPISNEDQNQNFEQVFHKRDCMYYNPQDFKKDKKKKSMTASPVRQFVSKDDNELCQNIQNKAVQEQDILSQDSINRNRSQSAYKPHPELLGQIQDFNPSKIHQLQNTQQSYSFNFGKQINIINNYNSHRSSFDQTLPQDNQNSSQQKGQETANWFNKALSVFYQEWKSSQVFQNFILKEMYIVANKGRPKVLSEIEIHKVTLHGKAPEFQKIQKLDSHPDDFLHDIDLSMRGTIEVLAKTEINIDWGLQNYYKIPITINIMLRSINGKIRVFYSNDKTKGCWYGFVGKPVIKFNLDPVIGKDNRFSIKYIPKLRELIEDLMGKRFDKYCLPNKRPLSIPITKFTNTMWPRLVKQLDKCIGTDIQDILQSQDRNINNHKSADNITNIKSSKIDKTPKFMFEDQKTLDQLFNDSPSKLIQKQKSE